MLRKFRAWFPDLQARVCRTYLDALSAERSMTTVCGGIMGIASLGHGTVQALLVPRLSALMKRVATERALASSSQYQSILLAADRTAHTLVNATGMSLSEKRRLRLSEGAWPSLYEARAPQPAAAATTAAAGETEPTGEPKSKKRKLGDTKGDTTSVSAGAGAGVTATAAMPSGLEEGLIPYYASAAPEAAHLRMVI